MQKFINYWNLSQTRILQISSVANTRNKIVTKMGQATVVILCYVILNVVTSC